MAQLYCAAVAGTTTADGTAAGPGGTVFVSGGTSQNATYGNGNIWKDSADTILQLNNIHGTAEAVDPGSTQFAPSSAMTSLGPRAPTACSTSALWSFSL